ncbi:hypothetical protein JOB18_015447 [Solea senegalensis]|uniref:Uncharacterized protein n=1 Tax=Solea senegalensis TaxID=28829 RepID=A0AAV6RYH4_SOLSE|nr:hypothetical protein JOB18_015447 [Solea senegalensis]
MTGQRLGRERPPLSLSLALLEEKRLHIDDRMPSAPPDWRVLEMQDKSRLTAAD